MKRTVVGAVVCAVTMIVSSIAPAHAITYGQPDAGEHPYVGLMIFFVPSEPGWFSCTGTLLDENTFLTAGHCTFDIGVDGVDSVPSGGTDVWVTFGETETGWLVSVDTQQARIASAFAAVAVTSSTHPSTRARVTSKRSSAAC